MIGAPMFSVSLRNADHVRVYSIQSRAGKGWDVTLEEDRAVRRRVHYDDWHRVERALAAFELEVSELTAHGWQEVVSTT